ncbi:MAG: XVIPCD domain-containing protein, partial [Silanimonas sp.]
RTPDDASDRVAAALTAEWRANGLTARPDGVVLGQKGTKAESGEYVFAYSGSTERPNDWVGVRTADAVQTPVEPSLAKAETLAREQALEAQQLAQLRQQESARAMG